MPQREALDFLNQEIKAGTTFPAEYTIPSKKRGRYWKVILISPSGVNTLVEIRKEARSGGVESLNFAPVGTCQCCGR